jgi:hypothetical protein
MEGAPGDKPRRASSHASVRKDRPSLAATSLLALVGIYRCVIAKLMIAVLKPHVSRILFSPAFGWVVRYRERQVRAGFLRTQIMQTVRLSLS